jgi:hypothetical protein
LGGSVETVGGSPVGVWEALEGPAAGEDTVAGGIDAGR